MYNAKKTNRKKSDRKKSFNRASAGRPHGRKGPRGNSAKTLGIHDVSVGTFIFGFNKDHIPVKSRPFYLWSTLYDTDLQVRALEGLQQTSQGSLYPDDMLLPKDSPFYSPLAKKTPSNIKTNTTSILVPGRTLKKTNIHRNDTSILPDLILRRVNALLYNPKLTSTSANLIVQDPQIEGRIGIVFNTISQSDILCAAPDLLALDTHDAPISQVPFTMPRFLEQEDIDKISLIARNYSDFCIKNKQTTIWPRVGTYPNWPESFTKFVEPQDTNQSIDFSEWTSP